MDGRKLALALVAALSGCDSPPSVADTASASPVASATSSSTRDADVAAVRAVLVDYKTAIYARDGEKAAALVAEPTITYFEATRKDALSLPEADLRKKAFADRLMVLMVRVRVDADRLRRSDGKQLFAHAVNEGMVGEDARVLEPGKVEVTGDMAKVGFVGGGQEVAPELGFRAYREKGVWKLDVMSIMKRAGPLMQKQLAEIDPDPDTAILKLLGMVAGRDVGPEVYKPIDPPKP